MRVRMEHAPLPRENTPSYVFLWQTIPADVHFHTTQTNREGRTMLPHIAFSGFASRYREPEVSEGFADIVKVDFQVRLSEAWVCWSISRNPPWV